MSVNCELVRTRCWSWNRCRNYAILAAHHIPSRIRRVVHSLCSFFLQLHLFAKRNRKHRKIEILDQGHHSVHRVKHATCVKRQSVREGQSERERGRLRNAKLVWPFGGVVGCLARPRPVCRTHAVLTGPKGSTLSMRFINCAVNQFGHLTICIRKLQDKTLSST